MKKLLIAMATLVACQAQAGLLTTEKDFLKTSIRCVAKDDASRMYFKTLRESDRKSPQDPFVIEILDYTFWPQMVSENKVLFVQQKDQAGAWNELQFGDSRSSAVTMPITMNDGEVLYCNIKLEKYTEIVPISILLM